MQQITPLYKSIGSLLAGNKFTIDEYQREYKWEQENISDLLSDLLDKFWASYSSGHAISHVAKYEDYFLGSIILHRRETDNKVVYSIVDGQQRITSITLLLINLYHTGSDRNIDPDSLNEIKRMIYSDSWGSKTYNLDIPDRHLVLEALFNRKELNHAAHNESVRNMWERYQDIESADLGKTLGEAFELFLYWIRNCVSVIEISCQGSGQAYDIFETMNDRGKPLSHVDMLKSFFLSHISDPRKLDHLNRVWRNNTYHINTWYGDYHPSREVNFFKAWFRAKYASKVDTTTGPSTRDSERINKAINRWARDNCQRLNWNREDVLANLIDHEFTHVSRVYISILEKQIYFDPQYDCVLYNWAADFGWQPTILLSPIKTSDDEREVSRKLRALARYIDIWIAGRFANGKRFKATDFGQDLFELTVDVRDMDFHSLKTYLADRIDKSEHGIVGGKKNRGAGIRDLRLSTYNKKGTKYLLARITDFVQRSSTGDDRTWIYWYLMKNDIEHIIEDNYGRYAEEFSDQGSFDSYRNTIGALVLLPGGMNKSLQDRPFQYKKFYYSSANLFAASLGEHTYNHQPDFRNFISTHDFHFKPYQKFGINEVVERTDLIAEMASHIWSVDRILEIE